MVGTTSTQTRVVGIITDEMHPYTFFIETLLFKFYWFQALTPEMGMTVLQVVLQVILFQVLD